MKQKVIAAVVSLALLTSCGVPPVGEPPEVVVQEATATPEPIKLIETITINEKPKWTFDEVWAIALILAGECYDDKEKDKRLVCEVILNRVSDGSFGKSISDVITSKNQFVGYWQQSRPVTDNDLQVAEKALEDWFENDCKALSEYLFFTAGSNRENVFRVTLK